MERKSIPKEASNYDELLVHHRVLFTESLKDLKGLSKQLYSAAEYFEQSYCQPNQQQQLAVGTLKDYINKAMISTVDHLGSVAYKLSEFLDEKADEISAVELRISCADQRLRTVKKFIDWSGFSHESFMTETPQYHKQYTVRGQNNEIAKFEPSDKCGPSVREDSDHPKNAVQASHMCRRNKPVPFSFAGIGSNNPSGYSEKRSVPPLRFELRRPGTCNARPQKQYPLEMKRSVSLTTRAEREMKKEIQPYSKKCKPPFKALFAMYKLKKDGRL